MELNEIILKTCKGLVKNCDCKILLLNVLGEKRIFLIQDFHLKTRECLFNSVNDAQDITNIVVNIGSNCAEGMTERVLLERTQSIVKENFKFGTDDYILWTNVKLNV